MQTAKKQNIVSAWLTWHFYEMPEFLFAIWKNYLNFGLYYFFVPVLVVTLFSPWRRYSWYYPRAFNVIEFLNTLVSNIASRIIGAICRLVLIVAGIITQIFIVVAGLLVLAGWVLLPFVVLFLVLFVFYV